MFPYKGKKVLLIDTPGKHCFITKLVQDSMFLFKGFDDSRSDGKSHKYSDGDILAMIAKTLTASSVSPRSPCLFASVTDMS
jgi:hypothetical protein